MPLLSWLDLDQLPVHLLHLLQAPVDGHVPDHVRSPAFLRGEGEDAPDPPPALILHFFPTGLAAHRGWKQGGAGEDFIEERGFPGDEVSVRPAGVYMPVESAVGLLEPAFAVGEDDDVVDGVEGGLPLLPGPVDLLEEPGVLEGHAQLGPEGGDEQDLVVEEVPLGGEVDVQHADGPALALQGHDGIMGLEGVRQAAGEQHRLRSRGPAPSGPSAGR